MCDKLFVLHHSTVRFMLGILAMLSIGHAAANECLNLLPDDTTADGPPKICQSALTGTKSDFACQDYRSGQSRYRVLYKGGRTAKAVLALKPDGTEQVLSSPFIQGDNLNCPLKAPAGVPKYATHLGMGVCRNDKNMPVACSVYQYAAARQTVTHSYMVYYPNDKKHKIHVEVEDAGTNDSAMAAEVAYQLGRSLLETSCCSDEALKYLSYAYHLFPRSEIYRHAYQRGRALLAFGEQ